MAERSVPQPGLERLVDFRSGPVIAGFSPGQHPLVAVTAARLAEALGGGTVHLAFVDTNRYAVEEFGDGTVRHAPIDPDAEAHDWRSTREDLERQAAETFAGAGMTVDWRLWYLAGRPDRALTHLARALDASVFVVGSRSSRPGRRIRELAEGSVSNHLAHHQHRPVLTVPIEVVDWKDARTPWTP
ncbi:universal stress protein [Acidipropionibacterium acidipropionici]|uniref:Universal stress protein UspA n=1 Tax=Acidipropionibacterium acidipropionici TaxID=1748 RepID=A0AAC8YGJ3_9ACTN|nr:universal stress protein [Acidipropionibacterium acidipropionici]AMS06213.1 universal stress protein UspA [Acidipropionibacterium acidipropionici]AOZ47669.1 universal stress protein UspA [Acidipropionibacterium acidipropionici]AZP38996.1 universal stress protein [Acidipropionibacterium acidipropionici]